MARPRDETDLPETKTCERCGGEFSRPRVRPLGPISHDVWRKRRYCSGDCYQGLLGERMERLAQEGRHPAFKGDRAQPHSGRRRARKVKPVPEPCGVCGEQAERHHVDENPLNNAPENIVWLCRLHHMERHFGPPRDEAHARQRERQREKGRRWRERQRAERSG